MLLLAILLDVLPPASSPARADAPPAARGTPSAPPEKAARWSIEEIFGALRVVETGGSKSGGRQSTGDGGRAIGPFQIHRDYWVDSKVPGRFEDCRDVEYARKVVLSGRMSKDTPVRDIMGELVEVSPCSSVATCMAIMTERRTRHLAVCEGAVLVGVISIGDVVKSVIDEQEFTIRQLETYITGSR